MTQSLYCCLGEECAGHSPCVLISCRDIIYVVVTEAVPLEWKYELILHVYSNSALDMHTKQQCRDLGMCSGNQNTHYVKIITQSMCYIPSLFVSFPFHTIPICPLFNIYRFFVYLKIYNIGLQVLIFPGFGSF